MFVPIHKLRYLSCVRPFCGAEQSASYVFILYTYWRKISIQNSMGHPDRCGFLLFSHKICRIWIAHTANEMCMKFSCTISGCPAGARKWHISYFATLLHSKKGTPPLRMVFLFGAGGGTRTHTVSLPTDFESVTSTNSITPALTLLIISDTG